MSDSLEMRLVIVGTGGMASAHAEAFAAMPGVRIVAGIDPNPGRRMEFLARHRIERGFASLDEALDWGAFDAASNVTPDAVHHATTMPLLAAGKAVLCEKPLAETHAKAVEMAEAAARAGVVNMVNLTYRNVPALIQAAAMVAAGEIGEVRHVEASYLQSWLTQPAWGDWQTEEAWLWRLSTSHGSMGVLGDIGVHIFDFLTYGAGLGVTELSARMATFDKAPGGRIGSYVLDANDSVSMHLRLENGATGVCHASRFASGHLNDLSLKVHGTLGGLEIVDIDHVPRLRACLGDNLQSATWEEVACPPVPTNYARFAAAWREGARVLPDFAHGADLQALIEAAVASDADEGRSVSLAGPGQETELRRIS